MKKYFNDAIIGNDKMVVSLDKRGKFLRLFYQYPDYMQFFNEVDVIFNINGENLRVNDDIDSIYSQEYIDSTNISKTNIVNHRYGIEIEQRDFCMLDESVYVRRYVIKNKGEKSISINPIIHSDAIANFNIDTCGYYKSEALMQYNYKQTAAIFSNIKVDKVRVNNNEKDLNINNAKKEYIGLSHASTLFLSDFSISKDEEKELDIYIYMIDNSDINIVKDLEMQINRIKKLDLDKKENEVKKHDEKFVKKHTKHKLDRLTKKAKDIYTRSILLIDLLTNKETGGISVAVEIDEEKQKSGRYSFSWPRDSYYVLEGLMLLDFDNIIEKYYGKFCKITQSRDGRWEQRFYTDGRLAPSWGYQIDETALVILRSI